MQFHTMKRNHEGQRVDDLLHHYVLFSAFLSITAGAGILSMTLRRVSEVTERKLLNRAS